MQSALKRVDNQLTIALPDEAAEAAGLHEGFAVDVVVEGGALVIRRHRITPDELLAGIKGPPPRMEWDDVEPRGSEIW